VSDHQQYIAITRRKLEEAALNFARVKTIGAYVDGNGHLCRFCSGDREMYERQFRMTLECEAVNLLAEMTMAPLPEREVSHTAEKGCGDACG
jgi:hypothetical protein